MVHWEDGRLAVVYSEEQGGTWVPVELPRLWGPGRLSGQALVGPDRVARVVLEGPVPVAEAEEIEDWEWQVIPPGVPLPGGIVGRWLLDDGRQVVLRYPGVDAPVEGARYLPASWTAATAMALAGPDVMMPCWDWTSWALFFGHNMAPETAARHFARQLRLQREIPEAAEAAGGAILRQRVDVVRLFDELGDAARLHPAAALGLAMGRGALAAFEGPYWTWLVAPEVGSGPLALTVSLHSAEPWQPDAPVDYALATLWAGRTFAGSGALWAPYLLGTGHAAEAAGIIEEQLEREGIVPVETERLGGIWPVQVRRRGTDLVLCPPREARWAQ